MRVPRPIEFDEAWAYVIDSKGVRHKIDPVDAECVGQWSWSHASDGYAFRNLPRINQRKGKRREIVRLHEVIAESHYGPKKHGQIVDHRDRDRRNDDFRNLRYVNGDRVNSWNTEKFNGGVFFHYRDKRWMARIYVRGKQKHLGSFCSKEEARAAYSKAAKVLCGVTPEEMAA